MACGGAPCAAPGYRVVASLFWICSNGCTNRQPNRPLMHRLPSVMALSSGEVAFTMRPSYVCSRSVQPTPQYGQIVSVVVCFDSW